MTNRLHSLLEQVAATDKDLHAEIVREIERMGHAFEDGEGVPHEVHWVSLCCGQQMVARNDGASPTYSIYACRCGHDVHYKVWRVRR